MNLEYSVGNTVNVSIKKHDVTVSVPVWDYLLMTLLAGRWALALTQVPSCELAIKVLQRGNAGRDRRELDLGRDGRGPGLELPAHDFGAAGH